MRIVTEVCWDDRDPGSPGVAKCEVWLDGRRIAAQTIDLPPGELAQLVGPTVADIDPRHPAWAGRPNLEVV